MSENRNTSGVSACEEVEFGHRRAPPMVGYNLRPRPHSAFQAPISPLVESTAALLLTPVGHLRAPGRHQLKTKRRPLTSSSEPNPEARTLSQQVYTPVQRTDTFPTQYPMTKNRKVPTCAEIRPTVPTHEDTIESLQYCFLLHLQSGLV